MKLLPLKYICGKDKKKVGPSGEKLNICGGMLSVTCTHGEL